MVDLVIPSNIPWLHVKGEELESLVYWLLDDMGAKDLEWRAGGKSVTSSDGGRDIEASFHVPTPDGDMEYQHWWVEVKGRKATVEPSIIKSTVLNVASESVVDVIVIVTNMRFSNATRDWVNQWQVNHPRPKVRLWDRNSLERMISRHPSVVARVYPEALSDQGCLEALRGRFWNHAHFASGPELRRLWQVRNNLTWSPEAILAVISSEIANGKLDRHCWLPSLQYQDESLIELLVLSFANTVFLWYRAEKQGRNAKIITAAVSYILIYALLQLPQNMVTHLVTNAWDFTNCQDFPLEVRKATIEPILSRVEAELWSICKTDCHRILYDPPGALEADEVDNYWKRFCADAEKPDEKESSELIIQLFDAPCSAGLDLDSKRMCPLFGDSNSSINDRLAAFLQILRSRLSR